MVNNICAKAWWGKEAGCCVEEHVVLCLEDVNHVVRNMKRKLIKEVKALLQ